MKLFVREKTLKAIKVAEDIRKDLIAGPKFGKRRALKRIDARIDHLNESFAAQEKAHRFANKAKTVAPKKAPVIKKRKSFNINSIPTPAGDKPFVMKDAKDSAKWMAKLLDQREAEQRKIDMAKTPVNFLEKPEVVDNTAFVGKIRKFTASDRIYEKDRRRIANAKASECLGHPAMASAAVFDSGIMAVELLIKHNPAEMGCKWLFEAIELRKNARDEIYIRIDDLKREREQSIARRYEASKSFNNNENLDENRQIIADEKEVFRATSAKIHEAKKQVAEIKAELKLLNKALKNIRNHACKTQLALIDARSRVYATRCKNRKVKTVGRPIFEASKPMLNGYKMMHFTTEATMWQFSGLVSSLNKVASETHEVFTAPDATDDEKAKARQNLRDEFDKTVEAIKKAKDAGRKLVLDAEKAKIHNARQSQLTDVIGVPYGKTTDMIISVNHAVANIFNMYVQMYLNADDEKDVKDVKEIMGEALSIATTNGLEVKMLPVNGSSRRVGFKFWNSNNSQLKVGKFVALSNDAYERAAEVGRAGMTKEEFEELWCNGSDLLKWWSYATTPGCPMMYDDNPITVNDVLVVKSISAIRKFKNVLRYNEDGTSTLEDVSEIERTLFDGEMLFLVPIRSQQARGGFAYKGFGTCIAYENKTTMIDEIAAREGLTIPETIEDIDGIQRNWRNYKILCTEDCWKWAGWKFGEEKRRFTYAEYCERMNKLAEKYPTANMMYTARVADATEESKRRLTRQSTQQFIFATHAQIERLTAKSVRKLNKWSTHDGIIRALAGLDKPEDERTAFEHLIEVAPELLDHPYMKRVIEDMFNRKVAEAAVRPEVDGIYPYLAEDPVVFIKIVFWKMNPNKTGLGYLKHTEVNAPETDEGIEMYLVRYPNNYLCGRVRVNHNDDIYRCVGNVIILSVDGGFLLIADGDSDGDEVCVIFDSVVVEMMKQALSKIKPPVIAFPHDKLKKMIVRGELARALEVANAMVIANMYGPEVGKNSNLATKFMHRAALAYSEYEQTHDSKKQWMFKTCLSNAIVAHIAAIIAIDLAKTGKVPAWLEPILNKISKFAGKKMPWNQRFCKDSKNSPWYLEAWDEVTLPESDSVVDRIARYVIEATNAKDYKAATSNEFDDVHNLLGSKLGLDTRGSSGKLNIKNLRSLEARNYRDKNSEGDDEFKIVENLRSKDETRKVSPAEMIRFLWRNQASLVYVLQKEGSDKLDNARMQNSYYEFCNEILGTFGSYCGSERFMKLDPEVQKKSNMYKFMEDAFNPDNSIAKKERKLLEEREKLLEECNDVPEEELTKIEHEIEELREVIEGKKASFALFVTKIFAYDMYLNVCEQKGITDVWKKPIVDETSDVADESGCSSDEELDSDECIED